ncbi:MAG: BatD family protein [Chloroherpetonaceae bacterium]|nr:BatD family protein [Chloroherpetonaceae bacterium]MDW8438060.1 BatD family protein [Chloroherpetonaceae bacterium]
MSRIVVAIVSLLFLSQSLLGQDVSVRAFVSESNAVLGSPIYYTVEIQGGVGGEAIPPTSDAIEIQRNSVSTSQSVSIVNGQMSQTKSITFVAIPKKEGKHVIPPATVKIGGQTLSTNSVAITVSKTATAQSGSANGGGMISGGNEVFIRPIVDKTKLVVGEGATITYKLYYKVNVRQYTNEEDIKPEGFWVERFDVSKLPQMTERYNGSMYHVAVINKIQVFPTRAGKLEVAGYKGSCEALVSEIRRNRGFWFDDFFAAPGRLQKLSVVAPPVKFEVSELPEPKPSGFSGAVGDFKFSATMDKTSVKAGEAVTLKFTIEGEGNVNLLPTINPELPAEFEKYEPKVDVKVNKNASVVTGWKTTEITVIPRASGKFDLGTVEFSYYNPQKKQYVTLHSPRFELNVEPDPKATIAIASGSVEKSDIKKFAADFRFIKTNSNSLRLGATPLYRAWWFYVLTLLPVGAVAFFLVLQRREEQMKADVAFARSVKASPEAKKRLKRAKELLQQNDQQAFFAEIENALVKFIGDRYNADDHALRKDELKALLLSKQVSPDLVDKTMRILEKSEFYRFAPAKETKDDLNQLYDDASRIISELSKTR